MFKWLWRAGRTDRARAPAPRDPVADAVVRMDSLGRLSEDDLEDGPPAEPAPEYIERTTEPSAEKWEHEREIRREKEAGEF